MVLTDTQHITQEIAAQLEGAGIRTVAQLRKASDEKVLAETAISGRVLKRIRIALAKLPADDDGTTRWEWPEQPNGRMLLWRGTPDVWAVFKAGYFYTADEDEIAALQLRADTRHDIYQVSMDADAPRHAPSEAHVPEGPDEVSVDVNTEYLQKGE